MANKVSKPMVIIASFYGCKKKDSGRIQHDTEQPVEELFTLIEEAYNLGLNIMTKRLESGNVIMYYSEKGFGQR